MPPKVHLTVVAVCLSTVVGADEAAARRYYKELIDVNGLNPLTTLVCFPESHPDVFMTLGFSKEMTKTARAKGLKVDAEMQKLLDSGEDSLISFAYTKGVRTQTVAFGRDKTDHNLWFAEFDLGDALMKIEMTLSPAGRYRRSVYVRSPNARAAATGDYGAPIDDQFGRCEPIL
jgi:hypothetical protein